MRRLILIFISICCANVLFAQQRLLPSAKKRAVYGQDFYVSPSKYDYASVAMDIVGDAETDREKASRLYLWICKNVDYDFRGITRTADEAWQSRKAVCQGYCELFYRLAETQGLDTKIIYGLGKRSSSASPEEHSWLSVHSDSTEILLDPTWGAGYMHNGTFVRSADPLIWFDVDPVWFVFTHFPKKGKNQYITPPVDRQTFDRLPSVSPLINCLNVYSLEILHKVTNEGLQLPYIYINNAPFLHKISLREVPLDYRLHKGADYRFSISKIQPDCKISLEVNGDKITDDRWLLEDGIYTLPITPRTPGTVRLLVSVTSAYFNIELPVMEWRVY